MGDGSWTKGAKRVKHKPVINEGSFDPALPISKSFIIFQKKIMQPNLFFSFFIRPFHYKNPLCIIWGFTKSEKNSKLKVSLHLFIFHNSGHVIIKELRSFIISLISWVDFMFLRTYIKCKLGRWVFPPPCHAQHCKKTENRSFKI